MSDPAVVPDPGAGAPGASDGNEALMSRIAGLEDALARERAKNQVLLEQVLQLEDCRADTDVDTFSDVVPNDSRPYWRDRLLEKRDETLAELNRMRNRYKSPGCVPNDRPAVDPAAAEAAPVAAAPVAARVPPKPLHNRAAAAVPAATAFGGPGVSPVTGDKAVWIRNRAQAISKEEGCSYTKAFSRAEAESKAKG